MTVEMAIILNYCLLMMNEILNETIRFERQKRHFDRNLQGHRHNFTIPELSKAWLGLTLGD